MKNWKKYLAVIVIICFVVTIAPMKAHADALTIGILGAAAFAIGTSLGITWAMDNMTGTAAGEYIEGKITSWMGGSTIAEKFGSEVIKVTAGKLIVPATVFNGILNFLNDYKEENETYTSGGTVTIFAGNAEISSGGVVATSETLGKAVYYVKDLSTGEVRTVYGGSWELSRNLTNDGLMIDNNGYVRGLYSYNYAGSRASDTTTALAGPVNSSSSVNIDTQGYIGSQPIASDKEWQGDFSDTIGLENPPDSVADFYPKINDAIADNGLDVVGEVTDTAGTVEPVPTEAPVYPPIDDVLGGLGQIEGTLDGIQDTVGSIDQALEGVGEDVGAIEQALEGVGEDVGAIEQAITDALDVPDIEDVELHKFNLQGLFPFCIPFDLHGIISAFSREPVTPSVSIPFNIPMIGLVYTFDLDLHDFDGLAQVLRTLEFIAFGVGLLFVTGKVIKW